MTFAVLENKHFSLKEFLSTSVGAWQRKNQAAQKEMQVTPTVLHHEIVNKTQRTCLSQDG